MTSNVVKQLVNFLILYCIRRWGYELMPTPKDLLRLAEFLKFALSGHRSHYFLKYVLGGKPLRVDGGLELRSQSKLSFRLYHLITKSLEFMVD
ncbi:MAG: hypothetical protein NZ911_05050 [Sulfolobales archaeon]|nr:hypothetical protein [Sulfolobales archaeon]